MTSTRQLALKTGFHWLVAILVAGVSTAALAAKPFVSKEGGFSMGFPSAPELENDTIDSPDGPLAFHMFQADLQDVGFVSANYIDYKNSGGMKPAERLDKTIEGQVAGQHATELYKKPCSLGRVPGLEVSFIKTTDKGAVLVTTLRNYLRGNRLFQVSVVTLQGSSFTPAQRAALLDSFHLNDK